jgi:hypothetical protein
MTDKPDYVAEVLAALRHYSPVEIAAWLELIASEHPILSASQRAVVAMYVSQIEATHPERLSELRRELQRLKRLTNTDDTDA